MARVECRFTFLDVLMEDEARGQDLREGRAHSALPSLCLESPCVVGQVVHPAVPTAAVPADPAVPAVPAAAMSSGPQAQNEAQQAPGIPECPVPVSAGSLGHPELCQRPCVHVAGGRQCEAGETCNYCHRPHRHVSMLDVRQRRIFDKMPKAEFLRLALQLLEDRARTVELRGTEVFAIFGILEDEMRAEISQTPRGPPQALMRNLRAANFSTLVSLAVP